MFDLIIRNAQVFDGLGNPGVRADVAVKQGVVAEIGTVTGSAKQEIDALHRVILAREDEHDASVAELNKTIESMRATIRDNLEESERAACKAREDVAELRTFFIAQVAALQAELQQTQDDLLDARRRLTACEAECHIANKERDDAIRRLAIQVEEHKAALARAQAEYNAMKQRYETQVSELQSSLQKLQKERDELRAALSAKELELQNVIKLVKKQQQEAVIDFEKYGRATIEDTEKFTRDNMYTVIPVPAQKVASLKQKPYLGLHVYDTSNKDGVVLKEVVGGPGSSEEGPGWRAGLRNGDVVVSFGNGRVETRNDFNLRVQSDARIGKAVEVVYIRDGQRITTQIVVAGRCESQMIDGSWSSKSTVKVTYQGESPRSTK